MVLDAGQQRYHLVCPAAWGGHVFGLLVVQVQAGAASELGEIMQELQWAVGWLIPGQQADALKNIESKQALSANAITLMAEVLSERKLDLGIRALLSRISRFDADKFNFGFTVAKGEIDFVSDMAKPKNAKTVSMIKRGRSFGQMCGECAPAGINLATSAQALLESQGQSSDHSPLKSKKAPRLLIADPERDQAKRP